MTCRLLLALVVLTAAGAARAAVDERAFQARTVSDLAQLCAADPRAGPRDTAARNFCEGFSQGVVAMELGDREAGQAAPFCFPKPAPSRDSTLREFVAWSRADAARLPAPAAKGLLRFMGERFPCPAR